MALNSVFIFVSCVLQMFNITRELNDDGSEKPLNPCWSEGISSCVLLFILILFCLLEFNRHLEPFPASFTLRFEEAEKLISAVF